MALLTQYEAQPALLRGLWNDLEGGVGEYRRGLWNDLEGGVGEYRVEVFGMDGNSITEILEGKLCPSALIKKGRLVWRELCNWYPAANLVG